MRYSRGSRAVFRLAPFAAAVLMFGTACSSSPASPSGGSPTPVSPSPIGTTAPRPSPLPSQPVSALKRRVTSIVRVGGQPDWQVPVTGSLFVANDGLGAVQRIDTKTNKVVAVIKPGRFAEPCDGMAAGFGALWIPDCASEVVDRVDLSTNKVVARVHSGIADSEGYIAVGAGSVWVVSATNTLSRIDPVTGVVASRIAVPAGSVAVAFGFGAAWVTVPDAGHLVKVNPSTNAVDATITVGTEPRFLSAGEGAVWVLNQADGSVTRVDPATGQVTQIQTGSSGSGGCIATGLGAVWVTIPNIPFTRIDAKTSAVTEQFHGPGGDCLSVGDRSVWLSNNKLGNVWRIPPS